MYIIGLTGGIACGKSSIAELLKKLGAKTFDIDKITHKLLKPGGELYDIYVRHFHRRILKDDGEINKAMIADIIFNNYKERQWINSVAHPILLNRTRDFLVTCANAGEFLVVLEIPLLFEAGWEFLVDEVWAVYVNRSKQMWRLMQRDKVDWEDAELRINAQMSSEEIAARADVVINNKSSGNYNLMRNKVLNIVRQRLSAFLTINEGNLKNLYVKRTKNKSDVVNLVESQENISNNSDSNADNLRGATTSANAENVISVPVP